MFSGAGAAAVATANMFVTVGVPRRNIWMCDIAGLIYHGRKQEMFAEKAKFAQGDQPGTLAEVLAGRRCVRRLVGGEHRHTRHGQSDAAAAA